MKSKVVTFSIVFTLLFFSNTHAQLTVNGSAPYNTIDYLVKNVLLGKGITVTNIEYAGSPIQIGFFNGQKSNLNLDSGIVMTTGSITSAAGPNTVGDSAVVIDTLPMNDPDLLKLSHASSIYDRASIDFDFIANSDSICFKYVFGSEEYMEFVGAGYNDAFGFFLSGPGISGPFFNKAVNLALIPNTETPVSIDSVNADINSSYYVENESAVTTTVQYDGFTVVFAAKAHIQCGEKYHIKLAIADAGNPVYDSGVFLAATSFSSNTILSASFDTSSSGMYNQTVAFQDQSKGASAWEWSFGDGITSTEENPVHTYNYAGTYIVTQVVTHLCNTDTFTRVIYVKDDIIYPNVFTPNGDGQNDEYYFPNSGMTQYQVEVYDRWGVLVYKTNESQNKWDGKNISGNTLPDGTYYYTLKGSMPKMLGGEEAKSSQGYITLFSK